MARVLQQLLEAALEPVRKTAAEGKLALEVDTNLLGLVPLALPRDLRLDGFPLQTPRVEILWPSRPLRAAGPIHCLVTAGLENS